MTIDIIDKLQRPEYTGENRCEPCTVLNLCIGMLLGSFIARKSKLGGLTAVIVSVGLIYLRGYLVPGTPTLTKQYLPSTVLRWFGKNTEPETAFGFSGENTANESIIQKYNTQPNESGKSTSVGGNAPDDSGKTADEYSRETNDFESHFLKKNILEPCADADDLCLTEWFEAAWFEEIEPLSDSEMGSSEVINAFGMEDDNSQFELVARNEGRFLQSESGQLGQWPSKAALIADIAASRALRTHLPEWEEYDPSERGQFLNSLRLFLETCPTSDGDIHLGEEVVESCCSSHNVIAVTCEDTGERLFEHPLADIED